MEHESKMLKRERFKNVAGMRTNKLLHLIRSLSKLSNTAYYEYTSEDIEKIFAAVEHEVEEARECFNRGTPHKRFSLDKG